ncbi:MAG: hypothetical protein ICV62_13015 [Cyanobacteria bacterium Co-bin13]|nr:hypothetical protein [Cyanobacteria bacterium Co-bin13]
MRIVLMDLNRVSGLRIATAVLVSGLAFVGVPAFAASDLDALEEAGQLHLTQRFSMGSLEGIDDVQTAYIRAMEEKLGL